MITWKEIWSMLHTRQRTVLRDGRRAASKPGKQNGGMSLAEPKGTVLQTDLPIPVQVPNAPFPQRGGWLLLSL